MTATLLVAGLGAGFGYGAFRMLGALRAAAVPLPDALADLGRRRPAAGGAGGPGRATPAARLGARAARFGVAAIEATGLIDAGLLRRKLRIVGRTVEEHAARKILGGFAGLALGAAAAALPALLGAALPPAAVVLAPVALGIGGWLYPDLPLNDEVEARQTQFRHALSSYIDLVSSDLAGGIGLETALNSAAEAGGGWAYAEIRNALTEARLTRRPVWEVFDELGARLDVEELRAVAATAGLAGDHGARVRESLAIKARSLRTEQLASVRAAAESASAKMQLPSVLFVAGLVIFLLYGVLSIDTTINPNEINIVTGP